MVLTTVPGYNIYPNVIDVKIYFQKTAHSATCYNLLVSVIAHGCVIAMSSSLLNYQKEYNFFINIVRGEPPGGRDRTSYLILRFLSARIRSMATFTALKEASESLTYL